MRVLIHLTLAMVLLAGCGGDPSETNPAEPADGKAAQGVFVGQVQDSDAYIAVVSNGEEVIGGYLCDGEEISTWLGRGPIEGGKADLVNRDGSEVGSLALSVDSAEGEVRLGSRPHAFIATVAEGDAGLYRAEVGSPGEPGYEETGWIVLADGSVRGRTNFFGSGGNGGNGIGNGGNGTKAAPSVEPTDSADFIDQESDF